MANRQASFAKRQKEIAQKARQQAKMEKRAQRQKSSTPRSEDGVDPDIAHIRLGPQPIPQD